MPSSPEQRAEQQRRRRLREKYRTGALFAQVDEVPVAFFGRKPDGTYVAIGYDGKSMALVEVESTEPRLQAEPVTPEQLADEPVKKLYPPKLWTQEQWTQFVAQAKKSDRDKVLVFLHSKVEGEGTQAEHKLWKQGLAIVEAIPDSPDWADYLPLYEEA